MLVSTSSETVTEPVAGDLDPNRIAVVPLVNRSDDPSLSALGRLCAERIVTELAEIGELEVVPTEELVSIVGARSTSYEEIRTLVSDVATATSARLVLTGALYESGNEIALHATLEDARSGRVVRAFETLTSPRDEVDSMLDTLSGWVFVTTMEALYPSLGFGAGNRLPEPEAFREYLAGMPIAGIECSAKDHLFRALEIDPEFHRVRLWAAFSSWSSTSLWQLGESVLRPLEVNRADLGPSQQRLVDAARWGFDGRWVGALGILQEYLDENPEDCMARACVIKTASYANRRRLALETFEHYQWEPVQTPNQVKIMSFHAADAHHLLGQYEEELAVLRQLWALQPRFFGTTWFREPEARALVALGRIDEMDEVIAEAMTEPSYGPERYGAMMIGVAAELRAHGHREESRVMAERAINWFDRAELSPELSASVIERMITALTLLNRNTEAHGMAEQLFASDPERWRSWALFGIEAARRGDRDVALEMSQRLADVTEPFTMGRPSYFRASIAAQLGDRTEAIRLLQQAMTRGFKEWGHLHVDINFDPVRSDPEFQEILRPKG